MEKVDIKKYFDKRGILTRKSLGDIPEEQIVLNAGYRKIWDAGHLK